MYNVILNSLHTYMISNTAEGKEGTFIQSAGWAIEPQSHILFWNNVNREGGGWVDFERAPKLLPKIT